MLLKTFNPWALGIMEFTFLCFNSWGTITPPPPILHLCQDTTHVEMTRISPSAQKTFPWNKLNDMSLSATVSSKTLPFGTNTLICVLAETAVDSSLWKAILWWELSVTWQADPAACCTVISVIAIINKTLWPSMFTVMLSYCFNFCPGAPLLPQRASFSVLLLKWTSVLPPKLPRLPANKFCQETLSLFF